MIIVVAVLCLLKVSISNGEGERGSSSLQVNDPVSSGLSESHSHDTVYSLMDFELPADNEGRIDTIILRNNQKYFVLNVIEATSPHIKIVVFLEREEIKEFGEKLFGFLKIHNISQDRIDKITLLPLDSKQPYWMRDNGILFINKKSNLITFVPCRSENGKKVILSEYMRSSASDNIVCNDSDVKFDFPGGEIVASESYIFCKTTNLFDDDNLKSNRSEAIKEIEKLCKKEMIDLSTIETPDAHIDLWLTPIDDKTIALGDVLLGKEIMGKIPPSECPKIINKYIKAERSSGFKLKKTKRRKNQRRLFYSMLFKKINNSSHCISINNVKEYLENRGFTIVVIPSIGQLDISRNSYYSYNNVLMETFKGDNGDIIKNIILPEYGLPLDQIARQKWELLGFHVKQFPMNDIARKGGAIRCSSQRVPGSVYYE
jgi:N-dimethylarginine dimethylaminohydrolase